MKIYKQYRCLKIRNGTSVFLNNQEVWDMLPKTRSVHPHLSFLIPILKAPRGSDLTAFL